jgi:phosphoglycolate phosphatase
MQSDLAGVAVIFDLDGTLVDTAADLAAAMNHALDLAGHEPIPLSRVRHLVGHGARAMLAQGFAQTGSVPLPEEMDRHIEVFLDYYHAHIADFSRPFPGAAAAIKELLRAGAKCAICTNKREAASRLLLNTLGIADLFATIVGADTTGAPKPDPAPVRRCLEASNAKRGVFVGDSDIDIKAAQAAGLPCLLASFGYGPTSLAAEATAAFNDYRSVPALVRKALSREF